MPSIFIIQYSVSLGSTSQYGSKNVHKHGDFKLQSTYIFRFIWYTFVYENKSDSLETKL